MAKQQYRYGFGFFLIKVEAIRIDDSRPAPVFTVVERPNEWAKATKASASSETQKLYMNYWNHFCDYVNGCDQYRGLISTPRPTNKSVIDIRTNASSYHYLLTISKRDKRIGAALYIPDNEDLGTIAKENVPLFEQRAGTEATVSKDSSRATSLRFHRYDCDIADEDRWDEYLEWQLATLMTIKETAEEVGF